MISNKSNPKKAGFTLIEITAVILIISLLMSMAIVRLDSTLPSTRTESAARELLADLDFARMQAVGRSQEYAVLLDFDRQKFGIQIPFNDEGTLITSREDRPVLRWRNLQTGVSLKSVLDARGKRIREGIYAIPFNSQGASRDIYIYLGNDENNEYELTARILGLTGVTSLYQGSIEPKTVVENDF